MGSDSERSGWNKFLHSARFSPPWSKSGTQSAPASTPTTSESTEKHHRWGPSSLKMSNKEEDVMKFAQGQLSSSQQRGLAGLVACLLPNVYDGSPDQHWTKGYLQLVVEKFLELPASQSEAYMPIVSARQEALQNQNEDKEPVESENPDPSPFLALLVPESESEQNSEDIHAFRYKIVKDLLWFSVKAFGYDARTRTLLRHLTSTMEINWEHMTNEEKNIGRTLYAEAAAMPTDQKPTKAHSLKDWKRNIAIGAAAVTGGALLAVTGGLAAPAIAASLSALGGAGVAIGTVIGSSAGVTATTILFGTAGAGVVGMKTDARTRGVHAFSFDLVSTGDGMTVYLCVTGWLDEDDPPGKLGFRRAWGDSREYLKAFYRKTNPEKVDNVDQMLDRYKGRESELFGILRDTYEIQEGSIDKDPLGMGGTYSEAAPDEHETTLESKEDAKEMAKKVEGKNKESNEQAEAMRAWRWKDRFPQGDQYCVNWEEDKLRKFGKSMRSFAKEQMISFANGELVKYTALAALFAAVSIPRTIMKVADMIDNIWAMVMSDADESGKLLASALRRREQGLRPVTLIGYGMGARMIFACLKDLAENPEECSGVVENVVMLGSPVPVDVEAWGKARRMVSGRLINGYSENDWMLGIMYRYQGWALHSAGISAIEVDGVENVNLSEVIHGHYEYKNKIGVILDKLNLEA